MARRAPGAATHPALRNSSGTGGAGGAFFGLPPHLLGPPVSIPPSFRPARFAAALALVGLTVLAACGDAPDQVGVHGLELQRRGGGYPSVSGHVVNEGGAAARSVDVSITLYDSDSRPIEDLLLQVRDVPPGDSVRFERDLDVVPNSVKLKYVGVN
ncbi:FxLYD domain-containing protein [Rubrivirga sp. S365]|uniref:FxLYD domain-containing protein n=1 Tax=Rubrivirga litoralis TaxID=3075598 RepID=A0ABU3BP39_9BACT|nr:MULTISPECIES: FxLYD domain-containing protein [unclassified Rubrivirga]MDT0631045.1 FxLYD domain-containing protein [Rubrivirga sp. F394]MDT7855071.1 FxLYD domain-containing protein [Rubrivirga sp. S365]